MKQQSRALRPNKTERVEPLSVLPMFLDLHGKRAIVVGGEGPAIWKAELLAKAGAAVEFICESPRAEILQFVSNVQPMEAISLTIGDWRQQNLSQAFVIIADVVEDEAAEFFNIARRYTTLVNVIDKPAYCTFQFGSIVNKSPLVIGISTSGAAPVLAQHVRSLLEATLPAEIQSLAKRAARIRARVNERLGESSDRRKYWSAFFGKAFGFRDKSKASASLHVIKVHDIEDLALRDLRALQRADKIYFTAEANRQILQFGRREAERIQVGDLVGLGVTSEADCNVVHVSNRA
jgi:uroporphyrin-III C-methyltransferase / precorrin-2 dehydrogenase / sirohydrochlorin ferrochelatase